MRLPTRWNRKDAPTFCFAVVSPREPASASRQRASDPRTRSFAARNRDYGAPRLPARKAPVQDLSPACLSLLDTTGHGKGPVSCRYGSLLAQARRAAEKSRHFVPAGPTCPVPTGLFGIIPLLVEITPCRRPVQPTKFHHFSPTMLRQTKVRLWWTDRILDGAVMTLTMFGIPLMPKV